MPLTYHLPIIQQLATWLVSKLLFEIKLQPNPNGSTSNPISWINFTDSWKKHPTSHVYAHTRVTAMPQSRTHPRQQVISNNRNWIWNFLFGFKVVCHLHTSPWQSIGTNPLVQTKFFALHESKDEPQTSFNVTSNRTLHELLAQKQS